MPTSLLSPIVDYFAKLAELRKIDCARLAMAKPTPPTLVERDDRRAVWKIQVPGQANRFMSARSGAMDTEFFVVNVGTELFYRTWIRGSPSVRTQRDADCVLRSKMPYDRKYNYAVQGFSRGKESPVPLASCVAFKRGQQTYVAFTDGVTRSFWLIANHAASFPVQVHGYESALMLHLAAGVGRGPTSFAHLFART